ncbi:hypothetical protein KsCSTR_33390 [Candidatus Kuenenia stuttgartiensis]|nr:hypothetical protein KsCSTR_33390 [Candidatus Kuenenia stuttgartiensis]
MSIRMVDDSPDVHFQLKFFLNSNGYTSRKIRRRRICRGLA